LLGLSFKPDTDDTRFSPALNLAARLLAQGADVIGYDPQAGTNAKNEVPEIEISDDPYSASRDAHCVVVCTEWDEIVSLDLTRLKGEMAYPVMVDGRNVFDPEAMARVGFTYHSMGRPSVA
jgi:UDPglucose 6-dehydrogenase